ncbi:murein biosynthesis integral membrane protein MurJ [Candidatus Parcubacteria bacterium]|nr:MAG: murein biosynthesis integral membrane protein MurJ [Candidatus Parcubacteria bacterium]
MFFPKILSGKSNTIAAAAFIVGAASLASRILGMLRDRVLAGEFGAGFELDIYYASFRIPDLIYNLIVMGAISAGFIPIFVSLLKKDKLGEIAGFSGHDNAWHLANLILNVVLSAVCIISLFGIIFTPLLIKIIAPGFDSMQKQMAINMTRIIFLSPVFLSISAVLGGILQSFKRFFIFSLSPIFYNIGIILGALYLVKYFGIYGLGLGVALGSFLHFLVQLPSVYLLGYRYRLIFNLHDKDLLKLFKIMVPRTLALGINQLNWLAITVIASLLSAGSLTVFNFANNLQSFPVGIFGISFAIAAFPTLAELVNKNNDKFKETIATTINHILFLIIPVTALFLILRAQIVRIVLGSGQFNWTDTILTYRTFGWFCLSLFAQSLAPLIIRVFYSFHDSKTPFFSGLASSLVNIIVSLYLVKYFGVIGLAAGFSLSAILNLILLLVLLNKKVVLNYGKIIKSTGKIISAAVFLSILSQGTKYAVEPFTGTDTLLGLAAQTLFSVLAGSAGYVLILWWLDSEELGYFVKILNRKIFKIKEPVNLSEAE